MGSRGFAPIRKTGSDGTLLEAGFRWIEHDDDTEALLKQAGWACALLAFFQYGLAATWPWPGSIFPMLGNVALTAMLGCATWRIFLTKRRSLIFRSDGTILTPHGIPACWYRRRIYAHHRDLMSIESALRGNHEYYVRIITEGGDLIWVGWHLDEAGALKVAVQLTKALGELRLATADARTRTTLPGGNRDLQRTGLIQVPADPDQIASLGDEFANC